MMKPSDKASDGFRVGFIGCGGISVGHFNQVDSIPWANVAAVCDIDRDDYHE